MPGFFIRNDRPKILNMKGLTKDTWETIGARSPGKPTEAVQKDLFRHPV